MAGPRSVFRKASINSARPPRWRVLRIRYELTGDVRRSSGTEWTVLYDELGARPGLNPAIRG